MKPYAAVHQFHSGSNVGDAVTQQMLQLQRLLRSMGFTSEIFAEHVGEQLHGRILQIESYAGAEDELLLVHHSMGHDAFEYVIGLANDIVTVYHNITPAKYFSDPWTRHYVRLGHEQLGVLAIRSTAGVADSNYNRREMLKVGFRRVEVLPVRTDFQTFSAARASNEFRSSDWLFVGRLVANKCQHDLVAAFSEFSRHYNPQARLILVGDTSAQGDYAEYVRTIAKDLGVGGMLRMLGKISEQDLLLQFDSAGTFVSLSEHEGFGVPLLEAMAAGVPVVAFGAAAIPETMGGAGVLLRTKNPDVVAATVAAVQGDVEMRQRLVERQFHRVEQVNAFDTRALLERVVSSAMAGGRPVEVQVQGPFETSYSLAQVNRRLAESLSEIQDRSVSIYATEGPGDYSPSPEDVAGMPEAALLYERAKTVPYPDVVIRQMWPPRLIDSTGGMTCEYFGWEESVVPPNIVRDFNGYLDGIGVFSNYVKDALRNSGVDVPIAVVGVGVDKPNPDARPDQPELSDLRSFRLLHISSAFPRKGVDVLLEAYFAEFSNADDISLILKTFPNPHNQVGRHLERLLAEHPDPPDVRWIDRDLETEEVGALYNLASCYVHPARGEGFGLPVAEAMAAGVPVIATSYSGLAEFVSDETAITIPYHVEPATSHVATPGSEWAEPDGDALRGLLRQSFESPHSIEIAQRVETAQALIADRFTWRATAQRWSDFVAELEESAQVPRVAMVSTWNSRCGIADYSRYIVENAKGAITYRVFADRNVETLESEAEWGVERSWTNRWTPDLSELDDALEWADPEIVHFQFNFAFFELQHLAALIEKQLPLRGVVVTLHRTSDPIIDGEVVSVGDIASTLRQVDKIIVHQQSDAERLRTFGITDNVSVIFHGAPDPPEVNGQEVKATIGLANRKVVGAFGFLLPHKGTLELLDAIDRLRTEIPDIHLLALCARHPDVISANFELEVRREILTRKLEDHVTLITDFLPDETIRAALTSADVIALPYRPTEESASGALRFILPVGKPVVATDLPIFADVRDALMLVEPDDSASLTASLCKVLLNDGLQAELAQRAQAAAQAFRWSLIVAQHREIYTTIRAKRQEASRALAQLVNG